MDFARYVPPHETETKHRATPALAPSREIGIDRIPAQRNVEVVLDLGDVRAVSFNGHAYLIAPVPFKLGERVSLLYTRVLTNAKKVALTGDAEASHAYHKDLAKLAVLLWQHIRPAQRWRRVFRRFHILRNPFLQASEKDLQRIADVFFQCRMTSSVFSLGKTTGQ